MPNQNTGWFIVHRGIANTILRSNDKMCDYGAFFYLLSEAAYKDHKTNWDGKIITLKRGQFAMSTRKTMEEFNWSQSKVNRFLKTLKASGIISTSTDTGITIITICKYDEMQNIGTKLDTVINTEGDTQSSISTDTNRTNKTNKTNKKTPEWHVRVIDKLGEAIYKSWFANAIYKNGYVYFETKFQCVRCKEKYYEDVREILSTLGQPLDGFAVANIIKMNFKSGGIVKSKAEG